MGISTEIIYQIAIGIPIGATFPMDVPTIVFFSFTKYSFQNFVNLYTCICHLLIRKYSIESYIMCYRIFHRTSNLIASDVPGRNRILIMKIKAQPSTLSNFKPLKTRGHSRMHTSASGPARISCYVKIKPFCRIGNEKMRLEFKYSYDINASYFSYYPKFQ